MVNMTNAFDLELFRARTHFNLRHNSIHSETWEKSIAEAFKGRWIKGSADLADAVMSKNDVWGILTNDNTVLSVKSRKIDPHRKKRIKNRDFITHPENFHFGGTEFHEGDLDNLHTVSRRCSIPGLNEQTSPADVIGQAAIQDYHQFEAKSLNKFKASQTLDVVIVHGENATGTDYLVRLMFFTHELNTIQKWTEVKHGNKSRFKGKRSMILGFDNHGPHIGRISNLGRQQTCMLRFYRKSDALAVIDTTIPIPKQEPFDFQTEFLLLK